MKEEKISINKNSEVTEILLQDKKAIGIKVSRKKIYADKIVLNTDFQHILTVIQHFSYNHGPILRE